MHTEEKKAKKAISCLQGDDDVVKVSLYAWLTYIWIIVDFLIIWLTTFLIITICVFYQKKILWCYDNNF